MNWDLVGALAELLAAVAVLASLIYLGRQLKEANNNAKFSTISQITDRTTALMTTRTDPGVAAIMARLREPGFEAESIEQEERVNALGHIYFNLWMNAEIAYYHGQLEKMMFEAYIADMRSVLERYPALVPYLDGIFHSVNATQTRCYKVLQEAVGNRTYTPS